MGRRVLGRVRVIHVIERDGDDRGRTLVDPDLELAVFVDRVGKGRMERILVQRVCVEPNMAASGYPPQTDPPTKICRRRCADLWGSAPVEFSGAARAAGGTGRRARLRGV